MRITRISSIVLLLIACGGYAAAQNNVAQEVRKLERAWLDAYEQRDANAMNTIVADDFTITFSDGSMQTKAQILSSLKNPGQPGRPTPKFHTEGVQARVYGDTVVLIGRVITEYQRDGQTTSKEQQRYTDTYVKQNGRWQVGASHLSNDTAGPPQSGVADTGDTSFSTFPKLLRQAEEKSQAQNWAAAIPLWERVVSINPNVARFWYALATAQINAGENRKAIPSLEKSLDLGARSLWLIAYQIAQAHALLKEKDPTLKWLDRSIELGFRNREGIRNDQTFAFLKDDPHFKSLTAEIDAARMSRTEGWRQDLLFVETEVKRMHYQPFRKVSQAQFETELRRLSGDVPRLTDNQIVVRLMRVMSLIGDGHTGVFPDFVPAWRQSVPLQFELFQEGLFVIAADPKYAELVGAKVLRFGGHPADQVIQAVGPIISRDNDQGVLRSVVSFIRYPQILNALGLVPQSDRMELTVRDADGKTRSVTVTAIEIDSEFSRIAGHPKWITAYQMSPGPDPLYMKDRRTNYWFEHLPDKTVYFQFNLVVNSSAEPLNTFLERLFKFIESNDIDKLVIDMRWNNGGNALLLMPLINGLVRAGKINRTGHLFVIVGRYTFSAAIPAAALIERHTNAIFVGEPTPSGPNVIAESNIINLPYSRVRVSISDLYWQGSSPIDRRTWIAPLYFVPPTFEAYKAKRDPALEMIVADPRDN